jgi:catecholate siderophore receptor
VAVLSKGCNFRVSSCLICFGLIVIVNVHAQNTVQSLRGKVVDPDRAAIRGAYLSVRADGKTTISSAITSETGEFSLTLEPGRYLLTVTAEGFAETSQTVTIKDKSEPIEIVLQIGAYSATVTITDTAGYQISAISSSTKTLTPLRDVPQSVSVISRQLINDQAMQGIADVVRYVPGITAVQGENNRDQLVIRGNSSSADFFLDGVRDDVQYYRDLYNLERLEALKGPNAMIFGRGGGGGVVNRVTKQAGFTTVRELTLQGGSYATNGSWVTLTSLSIVLLLFE